MRHWIELIEYRCIACGACAVACMDENDLDTPLRRCTVTETGEGMAVTVGYSSESCMHCPDAPCMDVCPSGCIYRDGQTGFVLWDNTNCVGCRRCFGACPVGAPVFGADGKMVKCHGCRERVKAGLLPACVKVCPMDALALRQTD